MSLDKNYFPFTTLNSFIWHERKRFRFGVFLSIMRVVVIAPFPFLFQVIVDDYIMTGNVRGILSMACIILGLLLLHYAFTVTGWNRISMVLTDIIRELRSRVFHKLQFLHFGYLDGQKSGRLLSKYAFDTQKVEMVIHQLMGQVFPAVSYALIVLVVLSFLNASLTLVVVGFLPIYGLARWWFFSRIQQKNRQLRLAQENLTGTASEYISALRLVRGYGQENKAIDNVEDSSGTYMRSKVEQLAVNNSFSAFATVALQLLTLFVICGGALLVIYGNMTIGTLFAFMAALPIIVQPVQLFLNFSQHYFVGKEGFYSLRELLNSKYVESWKGTKRLASLRGEIEFQNVTFSYSEEAPPALTDLNLHIRAGETVALVGSSGSGKSTIANLLLGLYQPQEGQILIDGIPQMSMDMRWLRRQSAIVMQESLLLSGSIIENIRFARHDATEEEILQAARLANAEEFILRMPQGFETVIGERGAMLSGGQRQRLSIARAILRDPRILILDEATSALDYESERLIKDALENLSRGRTVITIAHRLSTVRNADRIIVLSHGRIVEQGTYDDLALGGQHFRALLASAGS